MQWNGATMGETRFGRWGLGIGLVGTAGFALSYFAWKAGFEQLTVPLFCGGAGTLLLAGAVAGLGPSQGGDNSSGDGGSCGGD